MAQIIMIIDEEKYVYGTYPFSTIEEKNKVNELAIKIGSERDCQTYVKEVE